MRLPGFHCHPAELEALKRDLAGEAPLETAATDSNKTARLSFAPKTADWEAEPFADEEGMGDISAGAFAVNRSSVSRVSEAVSVAVTGAAAQQLMNANTGSNFVVASDDEGDDSEDGDDGTTATHRRGALMAAAAAAAAARRQAAADDWKKQAEQGDAAAAAAANGRSKATTKNSGAAAAKEEAAYQALLPDAPAQGSRAGNSSSSSKSKTATDSNPWLINAATTAGLTPQMQATGQSTAAERREAKLQRSRRSADQGNVVVDLHVEVGAVHVFSFVFCSLASVTVINSFE